MYMYNTYIYMYICMYNTYIYIYIYIFTYIYIYRLPVTAHCNSFRYICRNCHNDLPSTCYRFQYTKWPQSFHFETFNMSSRIHIWDMTHLCGFLDWFVYQLTVWHHPFMCTWRESCIRVTRPFDSQPARKLQDTAAHCNTQQHTATRCKTLQHDATHCNTLQHTAQLAVVKTWHAVHQLAAVAICSNSTWQHAETHCNTLQHTATRCNTLQHAATHSNTLQHAASRCSTLKYATTKTWHAAHQSASVAAFSTSPPQHTATHCNAQPNTAIHSNTQRQIVTNCNTKDLSRSLSISIYCYTFSNPPSRYTATHCNPLQHTATRCSTLQHTATRCNKDLSRSSSISIRCCFSTSPTSPSTCRVASSNSWIDTPERQALFRICEALIRKIQALFRICMSYSIILSSLLRIWRAVYNRPTVETTPLNHRVLFRIAKALWEYVVLF